MSYSRRGEPLKKPCAICLTEMIRPYKMTLAKWEKRRFCSQRCNGLSRLGRPSPARPRIWTEQERLDHSRRMKGKRYALGYRHTDEAKQQMTEKRTGAAHWGWKADEASYSAIHKWLFKNFGPANKCENLACQKLKPHRYEYALIFPNKHSHNRSSYWMLCVQCHRSYDSTRNKLNVRL